MGSSIKRDLHYDQIAFFPPGASEQALVRASEVVDFDGALFKELWEDRGKADYFDPRGPSARGVRPHHELRIHSDAKE